MTGDLLGLFKKKQQQTDEDLIATVLLCIRLRITLTVSLLNTEKK